MGILEPPEITERDIGAAGALCWTCQTGRTKLALARNAFMYQSLPNIWDSVSPVLPFSAMCLYIAEKDNHPVVLLRILTSQSPTRGLTTVVDPARPELWRRNTVADDVDAEEEVRVGEFPQV